MNRALAGLAGICIFIGLSVPAWATAQEPVDLFPNPPGSDAENEEVHIRNDSQAPEPLDGWVLEDLGGAVWALTDADGTVQPGQTVVVVRNGRSMSLNNSGREEVALRRGNLEVHRVAYENSQGGVLIPFP